MILGGVGGRPAHLALVHSPPRACRPRRQTAAGTASIVPVEAERLTLLIGGVLAAALALALLVALRRSSFPRRRRRRR
eukprot:13351769-Heterocapsa_arctica.AAC.1